MAKSVRTCVFPVAGLGTRFLPATKVMPKEMLPVVDKPLIQYAVEEAAAAGIEHFIFVTGRGKGVLEDHFDRAPDLERTLETRGKKAELEALASWLPKAGRLSYVRQQEPLGLGHAVWCARQLVGGEPFAVMLPDDMVLSKTPCLKQLTDAHAEKGGHVVAVVDVPREHTKRYGILDVLKDDGHIASAKGLVEKPDPDKAPSTLSIIGRYVLDPAVFEYLDKQVKGAGNEIQLTDAIAKTIGAVSFHGVRFEGRRFDCGDKIGWLEANLAYGLARPDMRAEVLRVISEAK